MLEFTTKEFKDYIRYYLKGELSFDSVLDIFNKVIDNSVKNGCKNALVDASTVTGTITTFERYELSTLVANRLRKAYTRKEQCPIRIAVVGKQPHLDTTKFGSTVVQNRGGLALVTDDVKEAKAFLKN